MKLKRKKKLTNKQTNYTFSLQFYTLFQSYNCIHTIIVRSIIFHIYFIVSKLLWLKALKAYDTENKMYKILDLLSQTITIYILYYYNSIISIYITSLESKQRTTSYATEVNFNLSQNQY